MTTSLQDARTSSPTSAGRVTVEGTSFNSSGAPSGGFTPVVPRPKAPSYYRPTLMLDECRANTREFAGLVEHTAETYEVPVRALTIRTLLHLPLLARPNGRIRRTDVTAELRRNADRLRSDYADIEHLVPQDRYPLSDLRFVPLSHGVADQIFSRLHYLRSARAGSLNFALVDPVHQRPVTLCSVSPLEWAQVNRQLRAQFDLLPGAAWDVSRVYSFDVAPANAISFLLAKVRQVMRTAKDASVLTTAVDPNLSFVGASYRAANWQQWMSVQARPYLYVDGMYASPRQLRLRFGGANLEELRRTNPGSRFEQSRVPLLDSWIFCCRLGGTTETIPPDGQRRLRR